MKTMIATSPVRKVGITKRMRLNTARGTALKVSDTEIVNTVEKRILKII